MAEKTLVIVPVHNEADALQVVLPDLKKVAAAQQSRVDIIVMCNGSTDGSANVAEILGVRVVRQSLPGKPQAVRAGLDVGLREGYDRMIVFDGDGQHPSEAIPLMLLLLENHLVVKGSRYLAASLHNGTPLDRKMVTAATRSWLKEFADVDCTDPPCGLVGLTADVAGLLMFTLDWNEEWEIELLFAMTVDSVLRKMGEVKEFAIPALYHDLPGHKQLVKYDSDAWEARLIERLLRQAKAVRRFTTKYCPQKA